MKHIVTKKRHQEVLRSIRPVTPAVQEIPAKSVVLPSNSRYYNPNKNILGFRSWF